MSARVDKGKVSAVYGGGSLASVTPFSGGTVTAPLTVPYNLIGVLPIGTPVIYMMFDDNTGSIMSRADGYCGEHACGGTINVSTDGDAIVIETMLPSSD